MELNAYPFLTKYIFLYILISEVMIMETAKVFVNGGSQAVRLPKNCRFREDEVLVNRIGGVVLLVPKSDPWKAMRSSLDLFTEEFLADGVEDLPAQERDLL